jgi:hypothetical protein
MLFNYIKSLLGIYTVKRLFENFTVTGIFDDLC